jgi:hypothetical protein
VGSAEIGSGSFGVALPLDPGKHTLVIGAPGHASTTIEVVLVESRAQTIEVAPGAASAAPAALPPVSVDTQHPRSGGGNKTLGYIFGGVGLVGLAVGGVAGAIVLSKKSTADQQCRDDLQVCSVRGAAANDSGRTIGPISTVGFIVGAAGLGAGAYFLLSSDSTSATALRVGAGPEVSQLSLVRRW